MSPDNIYYHHSMCKLMVFVYWGEKMWEKIVWGQRILLPLNTVL